MKYCIPNTNIRFKLGDVVEVPNYETDTPLTLFGTITRIEDTLLDIRGYYNIYINGEDTYYRSSHVGAWYRKNRKGVLVKYCDDNLIDKIWKNSEEYKKLQERFDKKFKPLINKVVEEAYQKERVIDLEPPIDIKKVKIIKIESSGLGDYKRVNEKKNS